MASPRTRRVLKDLKMKDDNNVSGFSLILGVFPKECPVLFVC